MTTEEARAIISGVLAQIAPDAELDTIGPDEELREGLDLDSMDFLNLVVGVHQATGIEIPESDYPKVATLNGFVTYLTGATAAV